MPRTRSPNRDKAFEIWKSSAGKKPLKDIAAELGVPDTQVRKWKNIDKWNEMSKGNVPKPKRNVPKQAKPAVEAVFNAPENEEITEQQQLFCRFFVNNHNAAQSARKAGYSVKNSGWIGYDLLKKPHIREEIKRLKDIRNQAIILSEEDIVERYMRIAFSDISDFADFGTEDIPIVDPETGDQKINDDGSLAVFKRNYLRFKSADEIDGALVSEIKAGKQGVSIKLEDRQKALEWLTNYFDINPMNKHKKWFDKQKLQIEREKIEIEREKPKGPEAPKEPLIIRPVYGRVDQNGD